MLFGLLYPGFGRPCRATHPGLWRDRPYRGFAPLSTSWEEASGGIPPSPLGGRLYSDASWEEVQREYIPHRAREEGLTATPAGEQGCQYNLLIGFAGTIDGCASPSGATHSKPRVRSPARATKPWGAERIRTKSPTGATLRTGRSEYAAERLRFN